MICDARWSVVSEPADRSGVVDTQRLQVGRTRGRIASSRRCVFGSRRGRDERFKRLHELRKIRGNHLPDDVLPGNLRMGHGELA